jgi:hypothetical protein
MKPVMYKNSEVPFKIRTSILGGPEGCPFENETLKKK